MRLMPRSLFGRLLATAGVALLAALLFAGFAIGHVLGRFVIQGLDGRLDAQIAVVARAVRPDGTLDQAKAIDLPPFDDPAGGWAWEVRAPGGTLRSASLGGGDIAPLPAPPGPMPPGQMPPDHHRHPDEDRPAPFDLPDAAGQPLHGRLLTIATGAGEAQVMAIGPRRIADRPLREAMAPLLLSLLLLGGGLAVALFVQLRFGLRPLKGVQAMLADVRAGRRRHVEVSEPTELLPLVAELNALIDANAEALARARGHVANLAHGLKTPLAALRLDLAEAGHDPDGRLAGHVERIDRHVRHHLGRARAASPAGAAMPATALAPHVADVVAALARIHADRPVTATVAVADGVAVRCDPHDLAEMLGNLLDNAWRWASATVTISARADAGLIRIAIADDGPGLPADRIADALEPGRRLDERGGGHGFGLSIARELAELSGGSLALANRAEGGLLAELALPGVDGMRTG